MTTHTHRQTHTLPPIFPSVRLSVRYADRRIYSGYTYVFRKFALCIINAILNVILLQDYRLTGRQAARRAGRQPDRHVGRQIAK